MTFGGGAAPLAGMGTAAAGVPALGVVVGALPAPVRAVSAGGRVKSVPSTTRSDLGAHCSKYGWGLC